MIWFVGDLMAYDAKKILRASLLIMAIGAALVVISMILELVSLILSEPAKHIVSFISTIYAFLLIPAFVALYFWAGMRAVKKYNLDVVSAGFVASFSHVIVGLVNLALGTVLNILVMSRVVGGMGFGTAEATLAAFFFGEAAGAGGIFLSEICGIGMILAGAAINFVIGGLGGLFAFRR
jgi:hypothetical protein